MTSKMILFLTSLVLFTLIIVTSSYANDKKVVSAVNAFYTQENKQIKKHFKNALEKSIQLEKTCGDKLQQPENLFTATFVRFQFLTLDYQTAHRKNLDKLQKKVKPYRKKNPRLYRMIQAEIKQTPKPSSKADNITPQVFCDNVNNTSSSNPLAVLNNNMSFSTKKVRLGKEYQRLKKEKLSSLASKQLRKSILTVGFSEKQSRELKLL